MYSLKASIQGHYENTESIVYYTMTVRHLPSEKSWVCNRKLEEFHALYKSLSMKIPNLPYPPGMSMMGYINLYLWSPIPGLEIFITRLLDIEEIYSCEELIGFFDLSLHLDEFKSLKSECIYQFETRFPTHFLKCDQAVILAAATDKNTIHRMEQYLQKIGYAGSQMSLIYCISANNVWNYSTADLITSYEWSPELTILALGFDDGIVQFIRIKTELDHKEYELFQKRHIHGAGVKGIAMDYTDSKVFTCGDDSRLVISLLNNPETFSEVVLPFVPIQMRLSKQKDKVYLISGYKDIYIYDTDTLQLVKTLTIDFASYISTITITSTDIIIVGGRSGDISIYSSRNELLQKLCVNSEVIGICDWETRKVVVVGNKNGIVSFWNRNGEVVYMFQAHDSITAIEVNKDRLFTAGLDRKVKTWKIESLDFTSPS
ncbi:hypothetical protein SteCoe_18259 [Stentor coeruleus]|uniref:PX domain-containing protein n=1 Tax=Stentor coeruleus TaxID=5963 RepID=A0A1R2BXJ6_9CILI|nr:hypothetical protein SteCoe_18259 [Stentor coeruleus]